MLVGAVTLAVAGGLGRVVGSLGSAVGNIVGAITATPRPSSTPLPVIEAPTLVAPTQPYTNQPVVTLTGTIPAAFAGQPGYRIRIEVSVEGAPSTTVEEQAVPPTASFTIPDVPLSAGKNELTARLVGPGGESDASPVITYILDTQPPEVVIGSPKDGSTVNGDTVQIAGRSQPLSNVIARNEANGATATGTAGGDGSFTLTVPLADGINGITITATDPAGNTGSTVIGIRRGSGQLAANLSVTPLKLSAKTGGALSVTVSVSDPNGQPLAGATVTITIQITTLAPIQPSPVVTDATGTATFATTIPPGADPGTGLATALVTTDQFGQATARAALSITP